MAKKCIPGVICIENMTLFLLVVAIIMIVYLYYVHFVKMSGSNDAANKIVIIQQPAPINGSLGPSRDTMNDPYAPPMKTDGLYHPPDSSDVRGVPVNVQTRGLNTGYQQVGILTRSKGVGGEMILPLMGRRIMSGRDKWQYYTMSNTGNMNTKLPVSLNGKSCTSEYGCDDINNGDMIYVEGYNDTFRVTMYENNLFQYIPQL